MNKSNPLERTDRSCAAKRKVRRSISAKTDESHLAKQDKTPLSQKFLSSVKKYRLVTPGDRVLIGVSGGADSIALLHLFYKHRLTLGCRLQAVHFDHHLRKTSGRDARFVQKFCETLSIPCAIVDLDLTKKIKRGGSIEEIAREERLEVFSNLAKKFRTNAVALGHHSDDLAETVLMRVLRGTGLQGLAAILPKRKINGLIFIRPLLTSDRKEIMHYLRKHGLAFCKDETNEKTFFFRNKVRLKLLPLLKKKYQVNIKQALGNLSTTAADDYDFLKQETLKHFPVLKKKGGDLQLSLTKIQKVHPSLARMAARLALASVKGDTRTISLAHLLEIEDLLLNRPVGAKVSLPGGRSVHKEKNALRFS